MRIFNATNATLNVPWGSVRLTIKPKSFTNDILGTPDFIKTLITTYTEKEIAILVGGPFELSMCAGVPACVIYVAQSVDEIYKKFGIAETKEEKLEPIIDKIKVENPKPEPEPEVCNECEDTCADTCAGKEFVKEEVEANPEAEVKKEAKPKAKKATTAKKPRKKKTDESK